MNKASRRRIVVAGALLLLAWAVAGLPADRPLPRPDTRGGMALTEALARRRSVREFDDRALTPAQVGQLCWAAQGITEPTKGLRTAPSAMEVYAIRVFIADGSGLHEYIPRGHQLHTLREGDLAAKARPLCLRGPKPGNPPIVIAVCMDLTGMTARAGARAERFALLEAGHATQNILLQATALGLAAVPAGGVDEAKTAEALGLPAGVRPAYLVPIGYPARP